MAGASKQSQIAVAEAIYLLQTFRGADLTHTIYQLSSTGLQVARRSSTEIRRRKSDCLAKPLRCLRSDTGVQGGQCKRFRNINRRSSCHSATRTQSRNLRTCPQSWVGYPTPKKYLASCSGNLIPTLCIRRKMAGSSLPFFFGPTLRTINRDGLCEAGKSCD